MYSYKNRVYWFSNDLLPVNDDVFKIGGIMTEDLQ